MAEDVDVSGSAYDGMIEEMRSRDFGTSDDDLKAYAEAAGGAAGAAGCAYVGAAAVAPLCAEIGGKIAGKVYDFIKGIFSSGPSDAEIARLEANHRWMQGWAITQAFEAAAGEATKKTYDMVRAAANKAGLQPSNQDIGLWLSQNCVGCWYVSSGFSGAYPWKWCYGCNTPAEYFRSYQDWGMPAPPGWPPDKRVGPFIPPGGSTTQAHLVAAQEYYRRTFKWILHDLMAAASGVIAKLATNDLKLAFGADGKVHLKVLTALVQWGPQGEATAKGSSSSSSSSSSMARPFIGAAAGAALGAGIGAVVDRKRRARGATAGALAGALVGGIVGAAL